MTYEFLQNYWWILVALLGGLLVALMFVQGANIHLVNHRLDDVPGRSSPPSRCSTAPVSAAPTGCGCSCW